MVGLKPLIDIFQSRRLVEGIRFRLDQREVGQRLEYEGPRAIAATVPSDLLAGTKQKHTLVYTVVATALLAAIFDLSRIASLGAIFYLVMDIAIHQGVFQNLRRRVEASTLILLTAMLLDVVALAAFVVMKARADPLIVAIALGGILSAFALEFLFLRRTREQAQTP